MDTTVTIQCDTTELDRAIEKLQQAVDPSPASTSANALLLAATLTTSPKPLTRRRLLRWWLPR